MLLASGLKGHWTGSLQNREGKMNQKCQFPASGGRGHQVGRPTQSAAPRLILLPRSTVNVRHLKSQWQTASLLESGYCMYWKYRRVTRWGEDVCLEKPQNSEKENRLHLEKMLSTICLSENKLTEWGLSNSSWVRYSERGFKWRLLYPFILCLKMIDWRVSQTILLPLAIQIPGETVSLFNKDTPHRVLFLDQFHKNIKINWYFRFKRKGK